MTDFIRGPDESEQDFINRIHISYEMDQFYRQTEDAARRMIFWERFRLWALGVGAVGGLTLAIWLWG